jgi:hypothetical protein
MHWILLLISVAALVDGAPFDHFIDTGTTVCDERRHKCEQQITIDVKNVFANMSRDDIASMYSKYVRERLDECDDTQ